MASQREGIVSQSVVSVHQPNFMLWLKLLDKILASDIFVAYDTVQFTRSEYHGRQKIRREGGTSWLSVPVPNNQGARRLISEVLIDNDQPFRAAHLQRIALSYRNTPYFDEIYPIVEHVYRREHRLLVDLSVGLIEAFCRYLGSPVRIVRASSLIHGGDKTDRLVQLVEGVAGDTHLTSTVGTQDDYIDRERFRAAGIGLRAQVFEHPMYGQPFGTFVPHLSALDMLCCLGRRTGQILADRRQLVDVVPYTRNVPAHHGGVS
jgi:hypothetical protein